MLSKKLFRWIHKVALFAVIFASLAPSISHALAAKQGTNSFAQEICTTDGQTLTIQVVTTKGKQLATEFSLMPANPQPPVTIVHQLSHCPFCNTSVTGVMIPAYNPIFALHIAHLVVEPQLDDQVSTISTRIQPAHLTRGPPVISL